MSRRRRMVFVMVLVGGGLIGLRGSAAEPAAGVAADIARLAAAAPGDDQLALAAAADRLATVAADRIRAPLAALGNATPAGSNWLRSGLDRAAERLGDGLKLDLLAELVADKELTPRGRSLAFGWLEARAPDRAAALLAGMLDEEALDLRRAAVAKLLADAAAGDALESPHEFFTAVKNASQLFVGVSYLTMTHNEAWHFGRLGRLLERADKTSRILDVKYFLLLPTVNDVGLAYDDIQWGALLKSASAFEMYRKKHGLLSPAKVVEFLLLERKFPRAIRYCVVKAERSAHAITDTPLDAGASPAERALGSIRTTLDASEIQAIMAGGLHEYLDTFQTRLNAASDAIHETFFALRPMTPSMAPPPMSQSQSQG